MHSTTRPSNGNAETNGKTGHGRPTVKRSAEDMMFPITIIIAFVSVMIGDWMYDLGGDRMYVLGVICANVATILVAWYSRRVIGALILAFLRLRGRLAVLLMEPTESNRDRCAELYRQIDDDCDMLAGACKALVVSGAVACVSCSGALADIMPYAGHHGWPTIMAWSISVLVATCGIVFTTSLAYLSIRAFLRDATEQGARDGYPALMRRRAKWMLAEGATMDDVAERLDVPVETLRHLLAADGMAGGNGHTEAAGTTDDAKDSVTAMA